MPETKTTIYTALMQAQKDMGPVLKNATNPAFKSKYADLSSVIETITEPLHKNGLTFYQNMIVVAGQPQLVTHLVHTESGESIDSWSPIVCKDPNDPQKVGGAITYMRRYSLLALLGLAPEDDDGNAASGQSAPSNYGYSQPGHMVLKDENVSQAPASAPHTVDEETGEKADPEGKESYYNTYNKKMYYAQPCSVPGCGRNVWAKSVSFSLYKFNRVLCSPHQKEAEAGDLDDTSQQGMSLEEEMAL